MQYSKCILHNHDLKGEIKKEIIEILEHSQMILFVLGWTTSTLRDYSIFAMPILQ